MWIRWKLSSGGVDDAVCLSRRSQWHFLDSEKNIAEVQVSPQPPQHHPRARKVAGKVPFPLMTGISSQWTRLPSNSSFQSSWGIDWRDLTCLMTFNLRNPKSVLRATRMKYEADGRRQWEAQWATGPSMPKPIGFGYLYKGPHLERSASNITELHESTAPSIVLPARYLRRYFNCLSHLRS